MLSKASWTRVRRATFPAHRPRKDGTNGETDHERSADRCTETRSWRGGFAMNTDWSFDGCDPDDQRDIEQLWEDYQSQLESKTAELSLEPVELRLAVTHGSDPDFWELQAALHLTTRTLVAEHSGDAFNSVFQQTVAELVQAIDEEQSRPIEASRRLQGLQAILPLLERNRAEGRSFQFFTFLGPLMRTLQTYTQRELERLELEGVLSLEDVEVDEVLDEALLLAWERFEKHPRNIPFDLWLISLVHIILDGYAEGVPHESLQAEREVALPEEDEQTSAITWVEQATYPEAVELGDLLPGEPGVEAWDRLDLEAKQTKLAGLLSYLSRERRQLLVLNAVEGFELEQIAALQGRSADEVNADLQESRRRLAAALRNVERRKV